MAIQRSWCIDIWICKRPKRIELSKSTINPVGPWPTVSTINLLGPGHKSNQSWGNTSLKDLRFGWGVFPTLIQIMLNFHIKESEWKSVKFADHQMLLLKVLFLHYHKSWLTSDINPHKGVWVSAPLKTEIFLSLSKYLFQVSSNGIRPFVGRVSLTFHVLKTAKE